MYLALNNLQGLICHKTKPNHKLHGDTPVLEEFKYSFTAITLKRTDLQ